jgi:hypothetical protein
MKLSLLEDGVLDYKGNGAVLATPNAVPAGAMGTGVSPASKNSLKGKRKLEQHIETCLRCKNKLCDVGERLVNNL